MAPRMARPKSILVSGAASTREYAAAGELLRALCDAALAAADPARAIAPHIPAPVRGRTVVVGAGKASAAMARAFETAWPGALDGIVVTRHGHAVPCQRIAIVEASHPVPDRAGEAAAREILELARGLAPEDQLVCLVSGGGSALLTLPAPGLSIADKQAVTRALLRCGATIGEINTVRKHLSAIKGGRLAAAAAPARVVTLAISDVPGDDPAVIASGPTVPDPTTFADARAVLAKYGIDEPRAVIAHLAAAADETPKPADPVFAHTSYELIASPQQALSAAADAATARSITPIVLSDRIEGEARDVAAMHAAIALQLRAGRLCIGSDIIAPPAVLLSGGETTVTVHGKGRGGRNSEFLLALAAARGGGAARTSRRAVRRGPAARPPPRRPTPRSMSPPPISGTPPARSTAPESPRSARSKAAPSGRSAYSPNCRSQSCGSAIS